MLRPAPTATGPRADWRGLLILLVAGSLWIWLTRVSDAPDLAATAAPIIGNPAPDFTLNTLDGQPTRLAKLKGKPVALNFWASWCGPCRAEMPELQRLAEARRTQGVIVIGVNQRESLSIAQPFAQSLGISFPLLLDETGQVNAAYNIRALPTTYFIDRNGTVRDLVIGQLNSAILQDKLSRILP